jgi:hypothetical protein
VEQNVDWQVKTPTLWLITQQGNKGFAPPSGSKLDING